MTPLRFFALPLLFAASAFGQEKKAEPAKKFDPARFEKAIVAFEEADKKSAPPKGAVLFIGSSSIRMWKVAESFPGLTAINRGFGGSHISDSVHFAERVVWPYEPKTIVFYAGDNDIGSGKSPEQTAADFAAFVKRVREKLPTTKIIFVCITPSIARWKLWPTVQKANALIKAQIEKDGTLAYADIAPGMLGSDGMPRAELFLKDNLHMTAEGYKVWAAVVGPMIGASAGK
jgi:lysophospholipase L1-like esterase